MSKVIYPFPLSNNTTADAVEVQADLDAAKDSLNAIDDENVGSAGLNEVNSAGVKKIFMDSTLGHTHSGVDAAELAAPTATVRGAMRSSIVVVTSFTGGWSTELNNGVMTTIVMASVLWASTTIAAGANADTQHLNSVPTGYTGADADLFSTRQIGDTVNTGAYIALDDGSTPHRIWVYSHTTNAKVRILILGT